MYQATRAVDGEILSEIAIHNFEKNRKIENAVDPNGEKISMWYVPIFTTTESLIETPLHAASSLCVCRADDTGRFGRRQPAHDIR